MHNHATLLCQKHTKLNVVRNLYLESATCKLLNVKSGWVSLNVTMRLRATKDIPRLCFMFSMISFCESKPGINYEVAQVILCNKVA